MVGLVQPHLKNIFHLRKPKKLKRISDLLATKQNEVTNQEENVMPWVDKLPQITGSEKNERQAIFKMLTVPCSMNVTATNTGIGGFRFLPVSMSWLHSGFRAIFYTWCYALDSSCSYKELITNEKAAKKIAGKLTAILHVGAEQTSQQTLASTDAFSLMRFGI